MTDFSQVVNEEEAQVEGSTGGGFVNLPPLAGVALLRLRDVIEFGTVMGEYAGKPKEKRPVILTFELVHPRHKINKKADNDPDEGPFTGEFIRYHEVTVRLNKTNSDKGNYMKLFNRMNYNGAVATPKGKVPSFVAFAGKGFLGEIHLNPNKDENKPPYVNLDKDGVYTIGAPRVPKVDALGAPTGEYNEVPVPEMNNPQRVFLWETGISDELYQTMWDSIAINGEKSDGTPFKNWIQESILCTEDKGFDKANLALSGSRAQRMFATSADEAALDTTLTHEKPADREPQEAPAETPTDPVVDPLAALGI